MTMSFSDAVAAVKSSGRYDKYTVQIDGDVQPELVIAKAICENSGDDALFRITFAALKKGKAAWYGSQWILVDGEALGEDGVVSVLDLAELHEDGASIRFHRPQD